MPRAKRSAEATAEMRDQLIAAAREAIEADGVAAVTARGLAQTLGWAVGTIYTVVPTLDALTLEVNAQELAALKDALMTRRAEMTDATPRARIRAMADVYLTFTRARPRRWAAVFERDAEDEPPEWYRTRQLELFAVLERELMTLVADAAEARRAARALWGALQGLSNLALAGHLRRVSDSDDEPLAMYLIETFLDGLEARRRPSAERET